MTYLNEALSYPDIITSSEGSECNLIIGRQVATLKIRPEPFHRDIRKWWDSILDGEEQDWFELTNIPYLTEIIHHIPAVCMRFVPSLKEGSPAAMVPDQHFAWPKYIHL